MESCKNVLLKTYIDLLDWPQVSTVWGTTWIHAQCFGHTGGPSHSHPCLCACSSWEGGGGRVKGFGAGPSNSSQRSRQTSVFGRSSIRTFLLLLMSVSMYTLCMYVPMENKLLTYLPAARNVMGLSRLRHEVLLHTTHATPRVTRPFSEYMQECKNTNGWRYKCTFFQIVLFILHTAYALYCNS